MLKVGRDGRLIIMRYVSETGWIYLMSLFNLTAHWHVTRPARTTPSRVLPGREELVGLWEEVLDQGQVGIDDDFFELGGDSLLALELVAKIEKLCGAKLPLSTLLQAKTVRQLAAILGCEEGPELWPSLVMIQPGTTRPPLFCVHPIGGDILCFQDLGRRLGPDQPVYALRARGLDGVQEPHGSVEEMARDYLMEIRQVQPEGPYSICGHSFGGLVAFEMARQLEAQGQKTALLAVLDSRKPMPATSLLVCSGALLARLKLRTLARKGWHRVAGWARELRNRLARTLHKATGRPLPPGLAHSRASASCGLAARHYKPPVYLGRMIFFRAVPSSVPAADIKIPMKWDKLAAGGVETHMISCEHQSMLHEPHVSVLAEQLKICLENARGKSIVTMALA